MKIVIEKYDLARLGPIRLTKGMPGMIRPRAGGRPTQAPNVFNRKC